MIFRILPTQLAVALTLSTAACTASDTPQDEASTVAEDAPETPERGQRGEQAEEPAGAFVSVPLISPEDEFRQRVARSLPLQPQPQTYLWNERPLALAPCPLRPEALVGPNAMRTIRDMTVVAPYAYVIDGGGALRRYEIATSDTPQAAECIWNLDADFGDRGVMTFDEEARSLSSTAAGEIFVQLGDFTSVRLGQDGGSLHCEALQQGRYVMSEAGEDGVAFWAGAPLQHIQFSEDDCFVSPIRRWQPPLSAISAADWSGPHIALAGSPEQDGDNARAQVVVVDIDASEHRLLAQPQEAEDALNYIQALDRLGEQVVALDSSRRRLHLWSPDGERVETLALLDALGLDEAWFADLESDGETLWLVAAWERENNEGEAAEVYEAVVYRISGLAAQR